MRVLVLVGSLGILAIASTGCEAILGINDHKLAPSQDSGSDVASVPDAGPSDATDSGVAGDSGEGGNPIVPPLLCGDSGVCVSGGIFSVGRTPDMTGAGAAALPGGEVVTLTDDGFEFGETLCKGAMCVTGAITP